MEYCTRLFQRRKRERGFFIIPFFPLLFARSKQASMMASPEACHMLYHRDLLICSFLFAPPAYSYLLVPVPCLIQCQVKYLVLPWYNLYMVQPYQVPYVPGSTYPVPQGPTIIEYHRAHTTNLRLFNLYHMIHSTRYQVPGGCISDHCLKETSSKTTIHLLI